MSAREAYEADCAACPTYPDGAPRKAWSELPDYVQDTWRRNPTPRSWKAASQAERKAAIHRLFI